MICGKQASVSSITVLILLWVGSVMVFGQARDTTVTTLHVKLKPQHAASVSRQNAMSRFGLDRVDQLAQAYQAKSIRRIFPDAGKYEAAHQAYGLHLWYEIEFPRRRNARPLLAEFQNLKYFEKVEERMGYSRIGGDIDSPEPLPSGTSDPLFASQWHYNNYGQVSGTPGADIDLLNAWTVESGQSSVIVAVIDGGIDVSHPDLKNAI